EGEAHRELERAAREHRQPGPPAEPGGDAAEMIDLHGDPARMLCEGAPAAVKLTGEPADATIGEAARPEDAWLDPFALRAQLADQIKRSIDEDRFMQDVVRLRRGLDLAFAAVLDREQEGPQRAGFLDGYRALTLSLDELERLHAV